MPVAQLDRASVSEAEGLEFESRRARFLSFDISVAAGVWSPIAVVLVRVSFVSKFALFESFRHYQQWLHAATGINFIRSEAFSNRYFLGFHAIDFMHLNL